MNLKYILYTATIALLAITVGRCLYTSSKPEKFYDKLRYRVPSKFILKQLKKSKSGLTAKLLNKESNKYFDFTFTALAGGKFSICVNDPINFRNEVKDSLEETPLETDVIIKLDSLESANLIYLEFEEIKITICTDPFNLTADRSGREVVAINSQQRLTFEEYPNTSIALDFTFPQALRAYGIPEHAEKLSLRTTTSKGSKPYRLFNVDRYGYNVNSPEALYGSVPVLYAHGTDLTAGVFWMNSAQTFVDITNKENGVESYFMSESGALEVFILTGPSLSECIQQYTNLTGVAPLPPIFSLGYHQSRYSYMSQEEVLEVSRKFNEKQFPLDALWMDIDYTDEKKYFTWNPETFSDPDYLINSLAKQGRKAVAIIDPHFKRSDGYFVFDTCESRGYFVKNPNGTSFQASCWPGLSSWIDFLNPDALEYYATLIKKFAKNKNLHIWNDMNEPSVFEVEEQSMDENCVHYGGRLHRDVHNQYGFYQTKGTYNGLMKRVQPVRPFILTRSYFAGSQRYAAHWTGDNVSTWEHLKISISMILTGALAGISFIGADVGGFVNNPSEELLQRWYQAGAWYPFFRGHSAIDTERREPYLFNEKVQNVIRKSIQQRYKHLHYWYTLFWEHYRTGEPVIRPLSYQYSDDINTFDIDNAFLVGSNILIHPITDESAKNVTVYLPGSENETWYNIDDFQDIYNAGRTTFKVGLDIVPVFYRGGSIIPIKETVRSSSVQMKNDPISLFIFLDKSNNAIGTIYDDDTESFDYLKNKYTYVNFHFGNFTLTNTIINRLAKHKEPTILTSVVIYGLKTEVSKVILENDIIRDKTNRPVDQNIRDTMHTYDFINNNKSIRVINLNLDVRDLFSIKFVKK